MAHAALTQWSRTARQSRGMLSSMQNLKTLTHAAALALSFALAGCSAGAGDGEEAAPDTTGAAVQALDAPQLVASTTRVNLGSIRLGSARGAVITLTNIGRVDADLVSIRIIPPDPYDPALHNPPGLHNPPDDRPLPEGALTERYGDFNAIAIAPCVRPQGSQTLLVGFTPTSVGAQHVTVVVSYVDGTGGHQITLTVDATGTR